MPEKNIEDLVDDENLPDNPGRRRFLKFAGNAVAVAGSLALEYWLSSLIFPVLKE